VRAAAKVRACAAAGLVALAAPAGAGAHLRTGTVAVDYRATIAAPQRAAYSVAVYESDRALHLTVHRGHSVVVLGYLGEPFLRVDSRGVAVNAASPTSASAGLLRKGTEVTAARPVWLLQANRRSVVWHDARVQSLPAGRTRGAWTVPVIVDGKRGRISGEIERLRRPALWPWLGVLALVLAVAVPAAASRRLRPLRSATIALGAVSGVTAVVTAIGFAVDTYASPGTWIAGADEIAFAAVGLGLLAFGPAVARVGAAVGLGLLGVAVGLSKGDALLHPLVLSAIPGALTRLLVVLAVATGAAAAILGGLYYASGAELTPSPPTGLQFRPQPVTRRGPD
jgi:hypothetical protein